MPCCLIDIIRSTIIIDKMERQENHYDYLMKFVIVGESRTGKTSLMRRYTENFYQDAYSQTIGNGLFTKELNLG